MHGRGFGAGADRSGDPSLAPVTRRIRHVAEVVRERVRCALPRARRLDHPHRHQILVAVVAGCVWFRSATIARAQTRCATCDHSRSPWPVPSFSRTARRDHRSAARRVSPSRRVERWRRAAGAGCAVFDAESAARPAAPVSCPICDPCRLPTVATSARDLNRRLVDAFLEEGDADHADVRRRRCARRRTPGMRRIRTPRPRRCSCASRSLRALVAVEHVARLLGAGSLAVEHMTPSTDITASTATAGGVGDRTELAPGVPATQYSPR